MKQLLIISGKGGTGKTTVAAAFARLARAKACADCDVDAPNLHFALRPESEPEKALFFGMDVARIDGEACSLCGECFRRCRFGAVTRGVNGYAVDAAACEGCGVCVLVCPEKAVRLVPEAGGEMMLYRDAGFVFSTARLKMGKGNSGKLVTEVKKRMKAAAPPQASLAVLDGSPGIGCPVIASFGGVDMALVVSEPSLSGIGDMKRIVKTAEKFRVPVAVCINKHDTDEENTRRIERWCEEKGIPVAGKIPFDVQAVAAVNAGRSVIDADCPAGRAVHVLFTVIMRLLRKQEDFV